MDVNKGQSGHPSVTPPSIRPSVSSIEGGVVFWAGNNINVR